MGRGIEGGVVRGGGVEGGEFLTIFCVNAGKLTKPQTTFFSTAQNMPKDVEHTIWLIWKPSCGAQQRIST